MSRIYTLSESVATRRRFPVFLVDATDGLTPETGEAGGQPQITSVGGAWVNTVGMLVSVGNGHYYIELTTGELGTLGYFAIRYKSANTAEFNMDGMVVNFNFMTAVAPTGDTFTRLGAPAGSSVSGDIAAVKSDTGSNVTSLSTLTTRIGTPSNLGTGANVAANLVDIEGQTDDIGIAGAGLTSIPWNPAWDAEVQSEAADALVLHRLDELMNADSDIDGASPPVVGSVFHELMSKSLASFTFDQTTDSLEAIRDKETDIETDTQDIQGRLPAALDAGNIRANVLAINGNVNGPVTLDRSVRCIARGTVGVGSTTTSIVTSSVLPAVIVADQFKNRLVTFDDTTTTTQLRGQMTDILSHTIGGVLTVTTLTNAPTSGDTFVIS